MTMGKIHIGVGICYIRGPVHMVNLTARSPPPTQKKTQVTPSPKNMPTVEELLAQKAKADEEFWELLAEVWKTEAEEKKKAEEKQKAEKAEEKCLKEECEKALAKRRAEDAEEKWKAREVDETQRMEEVEARKKKAKANALADEIIENHRSMEEAQRPSLSKAVMPQSIGGVLSSTLMAHQIASEVAQSREKVPKVSGSRPTISVRSDSELDNQEECEMYFRRGRKCTWDLRGKAKLCILCRDNKQHCEPQLESKQPSLKRVPEEGEELEGAPKRKQAHVVGRNSEMAELNKMLRSISEGIQGIIGGIEDRRKMDVKIHGVLLNIQSVMRDYVWKVESDARSDMRSVDGDQELVELEQEEQEKKALEMDVENVLSEELFPAEDLNQMLRE